MTKTSTGGSNPSVSLVINTSGRATTIRSLLQALESQTYKNFEVVVVVGPTADNTLDILEQYNGRIRVLRCPTKILGQSRNIGVLGSRGEIIAFIDDDAVPCARWLEQLVEVFQDGTIDATGGASLVVHPSVPRVQHRIGMTSSLSEHVHVRKSWLDNLVPSGTGRLWSTRMMGVNMAYRRKALLDVRGFDEFYPYTSDESDLVMRLIEAGKVVHPVMQAPVYHVPASSHNRKVGTNLGRWWLETRAQSYFAWKHGRVARDSIKTILAQCLKWMHGHWLWYNRLLQQREFSVLRWLQFSLNEMIAAMDGIMSGAFRAPQLMAAQAATASTQATAITPFQNAQSRFQPVVDPVNHIRPSIQLVEPPLRVCLSSMRFGRDAADGTARQALMLARGLFELGHTVHVVTQGDSEKTAFTEGAYVHHVRATQSHYRVLRGAPSLHGRLSYSHDLHDTVMRLVQNDGVQVLDSPVWTLEGLVTAISGRLPVALRVQTGTRQIAEMQDTLSDDMRMVGNMETAFIQRAAHLILNSRATLESMRTVYGSTVPDERVSVVPIGIMPVPDEDTRPFDTARTAEDRTILYMGRLEKRKGIEPLFGAIPTVLAKVPNARFVFAGADNSHNDGFRARTGMTYPEYFRANYGKYADRVSFMGQVSEVQQNNLYQSCDLFVAPSLYESFGIIYIEAMNYAKPVIGCAAGGVPEVVANGETGLLVEPGASTPLAEAIIRMCQSPRLLREMGLTARKHVLERYTHVAMARKYADVFRRLAITGSHA